MPEVTLNQNIDSSDPFSYKGDVNRSKCSLLIDDKQVDSITDPLNIQGSGIDSHKRKYT